MKTLVTARFSKKSIAALESHLGRPVERAGFGMSGIKLESRELFARVADLEFLLVEYESVTARVLKHAEKLKLAACFRNEPAASFDIYSATRLGIPVIYPPGRNAVSVAEYTIGLMLALARHIAAAHHFLRYTDDLTDVSYRDKRERRRGTTAEWSMEQGAPFHRFQGPELHGKALGLVGCGAIGQEIARRAIAFGMKVHVADPYVSGNSLTALGAERGSLREIAAMADFLAVAAKITPETRGLITAEIISSMKPSAYFINTARAAIVDYEALYLALEENRIAGAALDVFPVEPIPGEHPLRSLDNVILSPHLAGASLDIPTHHSRMIIEDVARFLNGEHPHRLANPEVWEKRRR